MQDDELKGLVKVRLDHANECLDAAYHLKDHGDL